MTGKDNIYISPELAEIELTAMECILTGSNRTGDFEDNFDEHVGSWGK